MELPGGNTNNVGEICPNNRVRRKINYKTPVIANTAEMGEQGDIHTLNPRGGEDPIDRNAPGAERWWEKEACMVMAHLSEIQISRCYSFSQTTIVDVFVEITQEDDVIVTPLPYS